MCEAEEVMLKQCSGSVIICSVRIRINKQKLRRQGQKVAFLGPLLSPMKDIFLAFLGTLKTISKITYAYALTLMRMQSIGLRNLSLC
jgi:hypothetical protein